jgi:hypothetical protein
MKRNQLSHSERRKAHFQKRWRERVGEILSDKEYKEFCLRTRRIGKFLHRSNTNPHSSCYLVKYKEMYIKVVFDPFRLELLTVLS